MNDEQTDAEPIGEDARLSRLNARLDAARQKEAARKPAPDREKSDANYRLGNRVLAELIGGLAGGAFIGWVIDQFAGTRPWGLLVMLFVGMGVAFRNIIRISNGRS